MEQDELTDNLGVEQNDETVEEDVTAEQEQTQDTQTPTTEQELAKAKAEAAKYRRLFEKAKRGSQESSTDESTDTAQTHTPSTVDVDERILKGQGMPDELLTTLKKVAQVQGVGLIEAQTDELFVAAKTQFEKSEKSKAAALGASRGSGKVEVRKTLTTPNLTREEHKKLVKG